MHPKSLVNTELETCTGCANFVVMVVGKGNVPLMPTSAKRARILLRNKRADVYKMHPFTIRILDRENGNLQKMELKFDPGSKTSGIALTVFGERRGWFCLSAWELIHRGQQIRNSLLKRAYCRSGRRNRKTRYRKSRFLNRSRKDGWLPPSLMSRVNNILSFSHRIFKVCPISNIVVEQVKFDTQLMENEFIEGVEYQQGTLQGYDIREYLLEKWKRTCAYCHNQNVSLEIDHIIPQSRGGSNRISNLCLACKKCNQKKGNNSIQEFLVNKPIILKSILEQTKVPLKDTSAVNSIRKIIVTELVKYFGVPVSVCTGGQTKYNRALQGYIKTHWIDAVCTGVNGRAVDISGIEYVTYIYAKGRGSRQMCQNDKYGFPKTISKSIKRIHNFQSGDYVKLIQTSGKHKGVHKGNISVRVTGKFDVKTSENIKITSSYKNFILCQRFNGYSYKYSKYV